MNTDNVVDGVTSSPTVQVKKSEAMRLVLAANPELKADAAVAAVKAQYGLDVSTATFYNVKGASSTTKRTARFSIEDLVETLAKRNALATKLASKLQTKDMTPESFLQLVDKDDDAEEMANAVQFIKDVSALDVVRDTVLGS